MTDVGAFDDLEDGAATRVDVDGEPVAVVRIGENVYAIGDICSHANISLSEGEVWCDELELECPKHASAFSLVTGEPVTLPATQPVSVYVATVADGRVVVTAPNHRLMNHRLMNHRLMNHSRGAAREHVGNPGSARGRGRQGDPEGHRPHGLVG